MRLTYHIVTILMLRAVVGFSSRLAQHRHGNFASGFQYHRSSLHRREMIHLDRDPDLMEQLVGGERYSMVPLPDSMMDTTLFVGNLCEFVHDDDLSELFQSACSGRSVPPPACVSRKPNYESLKYGFVYFASVEEKEAAIVRFDGYEWRGRNIKVQRIIDHPTSGRVRVPEKLVAFCCGPVKTTKRNFSRDMSLRRVSRDDVERLSRGQPSKRKGYGSRNVPHRLNEEERAEFDRAARKGFLTINGPTGNRRTRKGSPLINIHRQWCDARAKPQIILYKASNGKTLDVLEVDFSPLRQDAFAQDNSQFVAQIKAALFEAASQAGMEVMAGCAQDSEEECSAEEMDEGSSVDSTKVSAQNNENSEWATFPIWKLPVVSLGTFIGQRSSAKLMAKELAKLWDIPELDAVTGEGPKNRREAGARKGGRTKVRGISERRRDRGGGHRQAW